MPPLTVVIPAFNEAQRIGAILHRISECLAASRLDADIVVVDDGSADGTADRDDVFATGPVIATVTHPRGQLDSLPYELLTSVRSQA
jgi:dolichyl-phosphate beta-glucosyltransferase